MLWPASRERIDSPRVPETFIPLVGYVARAPLERIHHTDKMNLEREPRVHGHAARNP